MTEHEIVAKADKQVKEWIDYAKQEYGWEDKVFELFEEPMIEVATAVDPSPRAITARHTSA